SYPFFLSTLSIPTKSLQTSSLPYPYLSFFLVVIPKIPIPLQIFPTHIPPLSHCASLPFNLHEIRRLSPHVLSNQNLS
ncbi:hypothetical protein HAX54_046458, partial [Datura stramonium]|nr:hypothetical protein [Datura stramonium]